MTENTQLAGVETDALEIVSYPDPRLREPGAPIDVVDDAVRALAERMFELMFASGGVGLAAPQVGLSLRMFIASPTFEQDDRRVYINPEILSREGAQDGEEGCLSFPNISCKVKRAGICTIRAVGLDGETFKETGEGLTARIFQHEYDHLDGRLLVDRMGSVARMANRKALAELEAEFASAK